MKKKVLIDLSILKTINCGLGQIAYNYGKFFRDEYLDNPDMEVYLLVPEKYRGAFGNKVNYIVNRKRYKFLPFLLPRFDVWHAIHQLVKVHPYSRHTSYVLTIHDFNFMYEKKGKKAQKYLRKVQRNIDRASKIICISEFAKTETLRYSRTDGKPIEVILNGVEQMDITKARKPAFILSDNEKFFFSIGQIRPKKNFHVLLDLMKLMPDRKLYIAGQDNTDYAAQIRERIEKENISNVALVGEISNEERIWLYAHCEAFLFPSLFEGFGLPVIEAMQFGKPVFSSQETSLKEIGGRNAFFWESFEPEYMKGVIEGNLSAFYSDGSNALKNKEYARSFSYSKHINKYLDIYKGF